ncbi:hypothetical protein VOLCADRAFT_108027 [Volvox carteri f. nagariensis]|uniref:PPIase cyclophilin-type domain-containing protein n=1 Tax=Volvox carteri f. nagariensis TaxID=3068 RepID=D8UHU2_VOLCA|nr:uncharacterized protein VOLCADRAFT_108027 [Volvox carteri f. nagariensis]EFJ40679.1 hypothetical protein VOLCADRAFT_108027 [Volvox carteri f. nagariensis]|eukprot:XP_002958225.1 hypothetical protein VOLCADRAFT_108027 [Volvox carteri f. nagariensis]
MGKGGTKFVGDAVSVRRKAAVNDTVKNIKRNLDKFLETGVHPEIERMRQERANQLPALPDLDLHRPFVFLDIAVGGKQQGRLVVELFDDIVPVAANHFRNRCLPGSSAGLTGTAFHKLLPRYALHGGLQRTGGTSGSNRPGAGTSSTSGGDGGGVRLQPNTQLRAVEGGLVLVALEGEDFAISLDRALDLDRTHQVVGRIHKGRELLDGLGDLRTLPDDSPAQRVVVLRAGATNHLGNHEELGGAEERGGAGGVPPMDAATRLQEQSEEARSALMDALSEGLQRKRKPDGSAEDGSADAAGPSTAAADADGAGGAPAAAAPRPAPATRSVKARLLDSMLGDLEDSGSSSSSSDEDEDGGGGS